MTRDQRLEMVAAELAKARRTLLAARALALGEFWDDAVSRAYYAAFHAANAALASVGVQGRTHGGVHDLLFQHFVRSGLLSRQFSKDFAALQRFREEADYGTGNRFDQAGCEEELERAERVISAIERVILSEVPGEVGA